MAWTKRDIPSDLVILGSEEGQVKKAGGLLTGLVQNTTYPEKTDYAFVKQNGDTFVLSGSASLHRQLSPNDVGRFVKVEFVGWGKAANGKFKQIEVSVYEGEPTDDMKKWPRYQELNSGNGAKKPQAPATRPGAVTATDDDFGGSGSTEDDDLPF